MIDQITTIILAISTGALSSLVAFSMKRYLTMGFKITHSEK